MGRQARLGEDWQHRFTSAGYLFRFGKLLATIAVRLDLQQGARTFCRPFYFSFRREGRH